MATSACPKCGSPLRWLSEINAWGCDRCRATFPAQPAARPAPPPPPPAPLQYGHPPRLQGASQRYTAQPQPPQPPPPPPPPGALLPHGTPPPPQAPAIAATGSAPQLPLAYVPIGMGGWPAPASSSKRWLVIAAGGLLLVGVITVVAVLAGGSHGPAGGGRGTPKELLESVLAAASRGDVDTLVSLAGVESAYASSLDCSDPKAIEDMKNRDRNEDRELFARRAPTWKGVDATVVSIDASGDPDVLPVGQSIGSGCTIKIEVRRQDFTAKIAYDVGGKQDADEVTFSATQLGSKWYLNKLPKGPLRKPEPDGRTDVAAMPQVELPAASPVADPHAPGSSSPDAVAHAAAEAASRGDAAALVALSGGSAFLVKLADCPGDDVSEMSDQMKKRADAWAHSWKGVSVAVVAMTPTGSNPAIHAGDSMGKCKARANAALDIRDLTLRYSLPGGKPTSETKPVAAAQVGGRWYLLDFPRGPLGR